MLAFAFSETCPVFVTLSPPLPPVYVSAPLNELDTHTASVDPDAPLRLALFPETSPSLTRPGHWRATLSVQDGIYALGKAHNMRSIPSLRSFPQYCL